jgi:crossover junction endodeoxyribonuclease RuvC
LIILGVDPGSMRTGYGAIESDGRRHRLIEKGVLVPPRRAPLPERLHFVRQGMSSLIARLHPDILAVEDLFHAVNTRSALVLAHVRGVILESGAAAGLPVHAFAPATVKVQVTGYGHAAADALAVAICHAHLNVTGAA